MSNDSRSLTPEAQAVLRIRTIHAIRGGMRRGKAAETFQVTTQAIRNWYRKFKKGGWDALSGKPRGRPKTGGILKDCQSANICQIIRDRVPDQLRMPFVLWTADAVRELIRRKYGVKVSTRTVQRYLKAWGFTPQKPLRRAYEQDPAAVKRWVEEQYPAIRIAAKAEKAEIYWGDEMGLRSDHQAVTSYGRKCRTPTIPGTGKRFGCNMISAITNRGHLQFMVFHRRFNSAVFLVFLARLVRQVGRNAFLIVDGHPAHRSAIVKRWLAEQVDRIQVFYLPGYSPKLNPDELLNQDVKTNAVGRRRPADQDQMISGVRGYLRSTQKQPQIVRAYFEEENVRYAAT